MMKKCFLFGVAGLGLLFTGCQSDSLIGGPEEPNVVGSDQTFYVNVSISGDIPTGTRSSSSNGNPDKDATDENDKPTDFANGEGTENAVNNAYFVFYDAEGNVIGNIVQIDMDNFNAETNPVGNTVEKSYKSTVAITVNKTDKAKQPAQVICYFNPIDPANLSVPLSEIQTVVRDQFSTTVTTTEGDIRCFAMSNSVFYPEEKDENGTGTGIVCQEPQIAVQIPSTALYTSEAAAESALANVENPNVIKIYVERYATRLNFSGATPTPYITGTRVYTNSTTTNVNTVTLSFKPQYWALNAEAKQTYVLKSFRQESPEDGEVLPNNYTFNDLNNIICRNLTIQGVNYPGTWEWNNYNYNRSYWGMSPAYFQDEYPEVYSDLADIDDLKQTYISYNQLKNREKGYPATDTSNHYFKETTVGSAALNSANPAAAVASVIYVGQYDISVNGTPLEQGTSFYTYLRGNVPDPSVTESRPYVYFDAVEGTANSTITGGESMLKRFFAQSTILYRQVRDENGNIEYTRLSIDNPADRALLINGLEVSEISNKVKIAAYVDATVDDSDTDDDSEIGDATVPMLKIRNNARTLQFKSAAAATGIYIVNNNAYKQIVADDIEPTGTQIRLTDANVALMRQIGYSYYYTSGHGYFNIPVKHLGWYRAGNPQKDSDKIDWGLVRVGDFGMVRNHTYSINVEQILGLADGIGGDNVEIVPPSNTEDYYMAYSVRILKWAVVPTQNVKL